MKTEYDQERMERLMDEAFEALDRREPKQALKIGMTLNRQRYSGGFEVQALAYADLGQTPKAIKILQDGTVKCPDVWQLWQLLGNYLSDEERYQEAYKAYENGLGTDKAYSESLNLNYAIALLRSGDSVKARKRINPILVSSGFEQLDGSLRARILTVELEALRKLGDCDAAIACFKTVENKNFGDDAEEELSMLWTEYAQSLFEVNRPDDAEKAAIEAARLNRQNEDALFILRESRRKPVDSETSLYRLVVEGGWSELSDSSDQLPVAFIATYDVCADNEHEALRFVAEIQPDEVKNLRIDEAKLVETLRQPKGVYSAGYYMLYDEEESEK